MRYLNKREDFLKKKQHIQGVPYETLLEVASNAGPFANDVGWNDSLLGRLINHVIRKARIAAKVPRIKSLISQLKDEFEQIVGQAKIYSLSSEDQQLVIQIELDVFFKELIYAVENNFKVGILKGLTDGCIKRVTDMAEFDKKAVLLEELKKFREFLDQFKDDQGSNDDEEDKEDDKDSTDKSTDKSTDVGGTVTYDFTETKTYDTIVRNLKALALILDNYKKVTLGNEVVKDKPKLTYDVKANDTIIKIQKDPVANPNNLDIATIRTKNPDFDKLYPEDNQTLPGPKNGKSIKLIMESGTFGTGGSLERNKVHTGEDHLTQAFIKLKKDIIALITPKSAGIVSDEKKIEEYRLQYLKFINDIVANSKSEDSRKLIRNLYTEINRYLVGDKKATIQEKDKLYKESIELLKDKNKTVEFAEKIARFSKRALQFNKQNLYGGLGSLSTPLKDFVDTMLVINSVPKITPQKESLLNYKSFLEAILSDDRTEEEKKNGGANNNQTTTPKPTGNNKPTTPTSGTASQAQGQGDGEGSDVSAKILEFFNKTCIEVRAYTVSDEERKAIQTKIEQVKTEDGKKIEMTMDPIIAIMNLFIKAYKTYTVKTITKRTEGVDTNTLSEYTSFGQSGEDGGKTGPYRNNKLFDMWEEAVNNIRKDRKYQAIFTDNANLRLPKVTDPNPADPEDWTIKPKAGASFRKFINDMLDGDQLYKNSANTGAVATFIEKYFGDGTVSEAKAAADIDSAALAESAENAGKIAENAIKLELKKQTAITPEKNMFFTIEGMGESKTDPKTFNRPIQRTFFIDQITASEVWLIGTTYLKRFNPHLDSLEPKHEISQGDFSKSLTNDTSGDFYYTKISVEDFKKLKSNQKLSMTTQDTKGTLSEVDNIQITNVYTLNKVDDDELYKLSDEQRTKFNGILNKAGIKSDIKAAIVTGAKINTI